MALAYVSKSIGKIEQALKVKGCGKTYPVTVVRKPFYLSPYR
ncbi:MAG: glycine cleavage T C-terminal barrel domain-containing protein [Cyanobacteria bacterium J06621_8]